MDGDLTWDAEPTIQGTEDVLQNHAPETCIILLPRVTPINSTTKKNDLIMELKKLRICFRFYQFCELCVGVIFLVSILFHDVLFLMPQVSHFSKQTFMFLKKTKFTSHALFIITYLIITKLFFTPMPFVQLVMPFYICTLNLFFKST